MTKVSKKKHLEHFCTNFQGLEGQCHGVGEGKCDAYVLMKIGTNEVEVTQG